MLSSLLSSKLETVYATQVYQKVRFSGPAYCRKLAIKFSRIGLYQTMCFGTRFGCLPKIPAVPRIPSF